MVMVECVEIKTPCFLVSIWTKTPKNLKLGKLAIQIAKLIIPPASAAVEMFGRSKYFNVSA